MKFKKTKIIATLGPSTNSRGMIEKIIKSGVDVLRVNFSHANYDDVKRIVDDVSLIRKKLKNHVTLLADLQGPKIRIGEVVQERHLKKNEKISLTTNLSIVNKKDILKINYHSFAKDVKIGDKVLIDDGKIILKVVSSDRKKHVELKVIQEGVLKSRKGVNLPNTKISQPALTEKDIKDAIFALNCSFDWIALSFVRSKKDVLELKELIAQNCNHHVPIISKIEKPEAIKNMDEIIKVSNGVMVARGDLGIEIPAEEVPLNQKMLVSKCKKAGIPIIIATQMMESMIDSLTPSRAEVNDVANSVMDGADAVMLSGETSVGSYPVQVIEKMSSIIRSVEDSELISVPQNPPHIKTKRYITKSICYHAANMANEIDAKAISTLTNSGYTAFQISAWRPNAHILVFSDNKRILTQLNLLWGVKAFYYDRNVSTDETIEDVNKFAQQKGYVKEGDMLISLAAMPITDMGMVNTLRVSIIN